MINSQSSAEQKAQAQNARWITFIMLLILGFRAFHYSYFVTDIRVAQPLAYVVIFVVPLLLWLAAAILLRRGQASRAVELGLISTLVLLPLISLVIEGNGIALGLTLSVGGALIAILALPSKSRRYVVASFVAGATALLLDVFGAPGRVARADDLQTAYVLDVAILIVFGYFFFRRFNTYPLRAKLITAFMIVALVPLVGLGLIANRAIEDSLTNDANQALFGLASQTAKSFDAYIQTNLDAIRTEAQLSEWSEYLALPANARAGSTAEQSALQTLRALSRKDPVNIASYALLDKDGRNVLDTIASNQGKDESLRGYFQKPFQTGLPFVSPVEFAPNSTDAQLYFSSPVHTANGEIIGILRAHYNAAVLQQLITSTAGLGSAQSFAVLFDDKHMHLAHATAPNTLYKVVEPLTPEQIAALRAANRVPSVPDAQLSTNLPELGKSLDNAASQPYFTSIDVATGNRVNQVAVAPLKTQPWLIAFFQPRDVFLAPVENQRRSTVFFGILIAALAAGAAVYVGQLLTGPIIRLTEVASKVSAGDLDARAYVETQDETGTLARTFNRMTAELQQTLRGLEQRVAARTHELEESKNQLEYAYHNLQKNSQYLDALQQTALGLVSHLDLNELLQEIIARAGELVGTENGYVYLVEPGGAEMQMKVGTGFYSHLLGTRVQPGNGLAGTVWKNGEPFALDDYRAWTGRIRRADRDVLRAVAGVPLKSGAQVIGVIGLAYLDEARKFGPSEIEVLNRFAQLAAIALDNARLFEQTQAALAQSRRVAQREQTVAEITERLHTTIDMETILRMTAEELRRKTGASRAVIRVGQKAKPTPEG